MDAVRKDEAMQDTHEAQEAQDNMTNETEETNVSRETEVNQSEQSDITEDAADNTDTFTRDYVEKLRHENAKYRKRAQATDDLAHRLHRELVTKDGRLINPDELPYDEAHLDDADALTAAIDALLEAKPYLSAKPTPTGDIGQGPRGDDSGNEFDLIRTIRGY